MNKTTDWYSKFSHIGQKYTLDFSGGTYWDSYVGEFVGNGFEVQEKFDEGQNASFRVRGGVFNLKTRRFAWVQDYKVKPPLVVLCSAFFDRFFEPLPPHFVNLRLWSSNGAGVYTVYR